MRLDCTARNLEECGQSCERLASDCGWLQIWGILRGTPLQPLITGTLTSVVVEPTVSRLGEAQTITPVWRRVFIRLLKSGGPT